MNEQLHRLKQYDGEEILILLSYLLTMPDNSSFLYRIMDCQAQALMQLKQDGINWRNLLETLEKGNPMMEDPQENMFVQQVNIPEGSFSVFPGIYVFYQWNLYRLFRIAKIEGVDSEQLSNVYFLLQISQIIADRSKLGRYEIGNYEGTDVLIPQQKIDEEESKRTCFLKSEIDILLKKYGLNKSDFDRFVFSASWEELENEIEMTGFSDLIDLQPFYRLLDGSYLVLRPSALLHLAYKTIAKIIDDKIGHDSLIDSFYKCIAGEVANVILHYGYNIIGHGLVSEIPYFLVRFDRNKVAIVMVAIGDSYPNIIEAELVIRSAMVEKGRKDEVLPIIVYSSVEELWYSMQLPQNSLHFTIDEFVFVMSQRDTSFHLLYYYCKDKNKYRIDSITQEIDSLMYYLDHKQTFYLEQQPTSFSILAGAAFPKMSHYYLTKDIRNVFIPYLNIVAPIWHYGNVPPGLPVYEPYLASEKIRFLMVDLDPYHAFFRPSYRLESHYGLFLEIGHSIALWLYVIEAKTKLALLSNDIDVELDISEKGDSIIEIAAHSYRICLNESRYNVGDADVEKLILLTIIHLLQGKGELNERITSQMVDKVFNESNGHFMVIGNYTGLRENDGINECYYVSERWSDVILDDIADYLDMKGHDRKLSIKDSRNTIIKAIGYLEKEALQLLQKFDPMDFLPKIAELRHAIIYWSDLTDYRYKQIDNAYKYIGSSFEKQADYMNKYAEMNVIIQGITEYIVLNDIHVKQDTSTLTDCERLFALIRHIISFGMYLDTLNEVGEGAELSILANGRLLFYDNIPSISNNYFQVLRSRMMNHPDLLKKQHDILPPFEVDVKNPCFISAFISGYGFPPQKYFNILSNTINYAKSIGKAVVMMDKFEFEAQIIDVELSEDEKKCFFKNFVLNKSIKEKETKPSEFFIQRFNRTFQLTTRPWVEYEGYMIFSTKSIIQSLSVFLNRISEGILHAESKEMSSYIGLIAEQKGHHFTANLKNYYQTVSKDLIVYSEVELGPNCQLKSDEYLGDIDLLIIDKERKEIVCIEAKDYVEAKTIYEMSVRNKKMIKEIPKTERRHNWCKCHISEFVQVFNLDDNTYSLSTILLTYNEPVYYYFPKNRKIDIPIISAFEIIKNPFCIFKKESL
jgi:hypothetical protein